MEDWVTDIDIVIKLLQNAGRYHKVFIGWRNVEVFGVPPQHHVEVFVATTFLVTSSQSQ